MVMDIQLRDAVKAARAGEHVLIVCKSSWHASNQAANLHCAIAGRATLKGTVLDFGGAGVRGGTIEFGWAVAVSCRRLDDFEHVALGVADEFLGGECQEG